MVCSRQVRTSRSSRRRVLSHPTFGTRSCSRGTSHTRSSGSRRPIDRAAVDSSSRSRARASSSPERVRTMTRVQAMILCGGLGTRLAEETEIRPKPMIEIGGRPILWHIMKLYSHFGIVDFILCLGYKGDVIREYFLNYGAMNSDVVVSIGDRRVEILEPFHDEARWKIHLAETGALTQTGGRIHRVARYLEGDQFMVTYGDGVADVDLKALLEFHRKSGRLATITGVRPASRFGELHLRGDL